MFFGFGGVSSSSCMVVMTWNFSYQPLLFCSYLFPQYNIINHIVYNVCFIHSMDIDSIRNGVNCIVYGVLDSANKIISLKIYAPKSAGKMWQIFHLLQMSDQQSPQQHS